MKAVNKIKFIGLIVLIWNLAACQTDINASQERLSESFKSFEHKFKTDSVFRNQRTIEPLPGYNSDQTASIPSDISTTNSDSVFYWDNSWEFYYEELVENEEHFEVDYTQEDRKVTKEMVIPNSGFRINLVYELKQNDKWFLTYFWYQNE